MTISQLQTLTNFLIGGTATELSNANFLIFLNNAYERITGKLIEETQGGGWLYGDANYSAFPTYTLNLVAGTAFYQIDALSTPLTVMGVEVADQNGTYRPLTPITLQMIRERGFAQSNYLSTNGLPIEYEKREHAVLLYPAPAAANVTLVNGLRIFFLRTADTYTEAQRSTGTKEPGFPSPYHDILAYETAYTFAVARGLDNANRLKAEVDRKERELLKFISKRNQDDRPIMIPKFEPYF